MTEISKLIVGVVCALALANSAFAAETTVQAPTNAPTGAWVMEIGGSGGTTTEGGSESSFGLSASLGRTLTLIKNFPEEVGIRQRFDYASFNGGMILWCSTQPYVNVNLLSFNLTKSIPIDLYAGGNIGLTYGNTPLRWDAGPEVGANIWLAKNVALDTRVGYSFALNRTELSMDRLLYFVGVKIKF